MIEELGPSATLHNCKMRMGNTIGSSNFRGAANAVAISEEWSANHASRAHRLDYDQRAIVDAFRTAAGACSPARTFQARMNPPHCPGFEPHCLGESVAPGNSERIPDETALKQRSG
jgi:hypothetical protein